MIEVKLTIGGQDIQNDFFDSLDEAEDFVKILLNASPHGWYYEPLKNEWIWENHIIHLIGEEIEKNSEKKIKIVMDQIDKEEKKIKKSQDKIVRLNNQIEVLNGF